MYSLSCTVVREILDFRPYWHYPGRTFLGFYFNSQHFQCFSTPPPPPPTPLTNFTPPLRSNPGSATAWWQHYSLNWWLSFINLGLAIKKKKFDVWCFHSLLTWLLFFWKKSFWRIFFDNVTWTETILTILLEGHPRIIPVYFIKLRLAEEVFSYIIQCELVTSSVGR